MRTDQEHTRADPKRAVEEAERVLGLRPADSASRRAAGADGVFVLFAAMMAFCLVILAVLFAGLALGTSLSVLIIVTAVVAGLWFAHDRLMGGRHRH